ncbi:MAG TPA: SEC-C metal-binding domain-containing protein [Sedimentisphaerales bacterium]|nr:SEC-C metal-binding domain-containing protein [Sedimentisphaerales bacterium]
MQETKYDFSGQEKRMMEFFMGKTTQELKEKMDNRLSELKEKGHTLVRRVELDDPTVKSIARNAPCPCGSGHKYKRCCMKVR